MKIGFSFCNIFVQNHVNRFLKPNTLTLLSDCQKDLIDGIAHVFPNSPHGYCLHHLEVNFHKEFNYLQLKSILWKAARAISEAEFDKALQEMGEINHKASKWLLDNADHIHWAEFLFEGKHYGYLTSNIAESLNSWLLEAHEKPILELFEQVRHQLMNWFDMRWKLETATLGILVFKVVTQIKGLAIARAYCYRCRIHKNWQLNRILCSYVLSVILGVHKDPQEYAEEFYTL